MYHLHAPITDSLRVIAVKVGDEVFLYLICKLQRLSNEKYNQEELYFPLLVFSFSSFGRQLPVILIQTVFAFIFNTYVCENLGSFYLYRIQQCFFILTSVSSSIICRRSSSSNPSLVQVVEELEGL